MASKKPSLIESIKASLPTRRHGGSAWHERIDPAVLSELQELRTEYHAGLIDIGCKTLARAISVRLNADNISSVGLQGVEDWLKQKD